MKTPTIQMLGLSVIAATFITGVVFVASTYMIRNEIESSRTIWGDYQRISANRAQSLSSLINSMGYGGMIDIYKDFIIRSDEELAQNAVLSAGAALAAMETYKASPLSKEESAALKTIHATIMKYMKAIKIANEAIMEGETVSDIDKMVKIADAPAVKAIATLRKAIASSHSTQTGKSKGSKTEEYGKMLSALGYGGMIHEFKNYMIRGGNSRAKKIILYINDYHHAAKNYRAIGINKAEEKALKDIDTVVQKFKKAVPIVGQAHSDGLLTADIEPRIKFDDTPLKQGLKSLHATIEHEIILSKQKLTGNLIAASGFSMTALWLAIVATTLLILLNGMIIFTRIVGPIRKVKCIMYELAGGNTDIKVLYTKKHDEIGDMARAVEVFQKNALEVARLEKDKVLLEEIAVEERKKTMMDLAQNFEESVGAVVQSTRVAVTSLEETATKISENADSSITQADTVSSAAEESSTSVTVVASASQELQTSIQGINSEVEQSRQIANAALAESEKSKQTMQDLIERTTKISNIVEMISDIAGQTNLLALNATIEASRAGESGKGFAVVASEVKSLAEQTSKATDEIATQIDALQKISSKAAKNMGEIDEVIVQMNEFSTSVAEAITKQSAATSEIAQNIDMAAAGTSDVTQGITMVKSAAGATGETAGELNSFAHDLSEQSVLLDEEVTRFVSTIRTAW